MKTFFKPSFVKDFKKLPPQIKQKVEVICFWDFFSLLNKKELDVKALKGFKGYYRVRLGDYRIGFKKESDCVVFMRVKHRKDIYKLFP
ncbi:MAG TPA: type II toxin-antitoxin system RelE/ParE family toxin [Candidatus Yonathbacteria bacterium]|nr:type II toxin-antitoxin system RelE/ParE family toxin [Candidatus Yonathbacteria bacterium]